MAANTTTTPSQPEPEPEGTPLTVDEVVQKYTGHSNEYWLTAAEPFDWTTLPREFYEEMTRAQVHMMQSGEGYLPAQNDPKYLADHTLCAPWPGTDYPKTLVPIPKTSCDVLLWSNKASESAQGFNYQVVERGKNTVPIDPAAHQLEVLFHNDYEGSWQAPLAAEFVALATEGLHVKVEVLSLPSDDPDRQFVFQFPYRPRAAGGVNSSNLKFALY
ncbi:hypothetical protein C8F01DRAFT_1153002 [Mycena amicta]|nr:hypothetical protein C8F01DRAFT_1153002 [Mycena amicta]